MASPVRTGPPSTDRRGQRIRVKKNGPGRKGSPGREGGRTRREETHVSPRRRSKGAEPQRRAGRRQARTQWVATRGSMEGSGRLGGRGGAGAGLAQVGPVDVGAELLAGHRATRRFFDRWAIVRRHVSTPMPVAHHLLFHPQRPGEFRLGAEGFEGLRQCTHGAHYQHVGIACQQVEFARLNICFRLPSWPSENASSNDIFCKANSPRVDMT